MDSLGNKVINLNGKDTHLSLPNKGESPIITDAKADFTCWLGSITKSCIKPQKIY